MGLKCVFRDKLITPSEANTSPRYSEALVTKADESRNLCNILYTSHDNKRKSVNNVEVKIITDNDTWFPSIGDWVSVIDYNSGDPVIIGPRITNFEQDIKWKLYDMNNTGIASYFTIGGKYS